MRGTPDPQLAMLSSLSTEDLIPPDHPIRRIRVVVDAVLAELDPVFDAMYAAGGRRSVPPETLLKATVLMALYSIRSERAFCERLNYDLMFKWFLDLRIDQPGLDDRPRCPVVSQVGGDAGPALLCGAPVDGTPFGVDRRRRADRGRRVRRTGHRPRDAGPAPGHGPAAHRRRRQGLRHQRVRRRRPRSWVHPPCPPPPV